MFIVIFYQSIEAPEERSVNSCLVSLPRSPYLQDAPTELLVITNFCYYKQLATP
jgi:hypothetical protein